jgi:hypothetical protein
MTDELFSDDADSIIFNGINGVTGQPFTKSLSELAQLIKTNPAEDDPEKQEEIELLTAAQAPSTRAFALSARITDEGDLKQTGWGIVFHQNEDPAVIAALQPLIEHRRQQIGDVRKAILLETDYRGGESYRDWLKRHGVAPVNVKPHKVPYYLLLIGSPEQIPYSFGYQLDLDYAVGRLHFDTVAQYENYARSVIDYETSHAVPHAKEAVFFGTRHPLDKATNMSANLLLKPLTDGIPNDGVAPVAEDFGFRQRKLVGQDAKKSALAEIFHPGAGAAPPAFLFTATHGLEWPLSDARQRTEQGALVCQDWSLGKPAQANHYFAAADLSANAKVHGLIAFNFACFGAGTPTHDRFAHQPGHFHSFIAASLTRARQRRRARLHRPRRTRLGLLDFDRRRRHDSAVSERHYPHHDGPTGRPRAERLQRKVRQRQHRTVRAA